MALDDHDKHFVGQIAQKALIIKEGKLLAVKYPPKDPEGEVWDLPGGRFHADEEPIDGVKREVKEEVGAEVTTEGILHAGTFYFKDGQKLFYLIYRASLVDPQQELVPEAGEIAEIKWFEPKEFYELPLIHDEYKEALKGILV